MKTPEEIIKQHAPGIILFGAGDGSVHKWNAVIKAMEEYAKEYASKELQRLSKEKEELREHLDEAYKELQFHNWHLSSTGRKINAFLNTKE